MGLTKSPPLRVQKTADLKFNTKMRTARLRNVLFDDDDTSEIIPKLKIKPVIDRPNLKPFSAHDKKISPDNKSKLGVVIRLTDEIKPPLSYRNSPLSFNR